MVPEMMRLILVVSLCLLGGASASSSLPDVAGFDLIAERGYVSGLGPLARRYSTTVEACAEECLENPECKGFDWDTKDSDCQLESKNYEDAVAEGYWTADADGDWVFYSAIPTTTSTSTSSTTSTTTQWIPDGFDLISVRGYVSGLGPLRRIYSTTVEDCAAACLEDAECQGFDWDTKDSDCQLESKNYEDAVGEGYWTTDADGDWVFYSLISTTSSTSTSETSTSTSTSETSTSTSETTQTSTSTTGTPSPCLKFCDLVDNTHLDQDCGAHGNEAACTMSFLRPSGNTHVRCRWLAAQSRCAAAPPSSALSCPELVFSECRCTSTSSWTNKRCRMNCDVTAGGSYASGCANRCSATCPANAGGSRRLLHRLRGGA